LAFVAIFYYAAPKRTGQIRVDMLKVIRNETVERKELMIKPKEGSYSDMELWSRFILLIIRLLLFLCGNTNRDRGYNYFVYVFIIIVKGFII